MKTFAALLVALLVPAIGAAKDCSKADAGNAEKALDRVVNWQGMYKAWQDYGHCDTGPVGEAFTEALLRLIVEWKNVDTLAKAMNEAKYREFVVARLSAREMAHLVRAIGCAPARTRLGTRISSVLPHPIVRTTPPRP